ncbi:beta-hydroxyacyl-ACP dehydratase [Candidatus Woesearchaeota archaeon]|nr:beta-hydroxyacyl-ACP dehydratase [Candidatus Woesearchaeota archaeon]
MNQEIEALKNQKGGIEKADIGKIIPYRAPFLLVDKVVRLDDKSIVATKTFARDEAIIQGHFSDFAIVPGALIIEALGQAATLLIRSQLKDHQNKDILAYEIRDVKFRLPVFPEEEMRLEVELSGMDERRAKVYGRVLKDEKTVTEGVMTVAIVDKKEFRGKYSR